MPLYSNLIVAAVPIDIAAGKKDENLKAASKAIAGVPAGADIIVLPELFTTSFIPDATACASLAEDNDGPTMTWAKGVAHLTGAAIAGSFLAKEGGELFNRAFFVEPSGDAVFYDKRHTFRLGRESEIITRGAQPSPIARFRGWNVSLSVCYDLRFPVWMRNADLKYDLMIVPANWPNSRQFAWEHLLQARAIENQAVYIGANRSGSDEFGQYDDSSFIIDCMGRSIGTPYDTCICATISKKELEKARTALPASLDADVFTIAFR